MLLREYAHGDMIKAIILQEIMWSLYIILKFELPINTCLHYDELG